MAWNRVLLGGIILLNVFLVYKLLFSGQGLFAYNELKSKYSELEERIESLNSLTVELSQEIRLLKSDRPYVEKMIRENMHFVKKDEVLYVFPEGEPNASAGAGPDDDQN